MSRANPDERSVGDHRYLPNRLNPELFAQLFFNQQDAGTLLGSAARLAKLRHDKTTADRRADMMYLCFKDPDKPTTGDKPKEKKDKEPDIDPEEAAKAKLIELIDRKRMDRIYAPRID